jgi:hypothetical protein
MCSMKKQKEKPKPSQSPSSTPTHFYYNLLLLVSVLATCVNTTSASAGALNNTVAFLVPRHSKSAHQINERNTLTNKLENGWLIKANENIELLLYVLVAEDIKNLNEIKAGIIYFTTDPSECKPRHSDGDADTDRDTELFFQLTFLKGKSKTHAGSVNSNPSGGDGNASGGDPFAYLPTNPPASNSTLLVANVDVNIVHNDAKYYTCFYFAKKEHPDDALDLENLYQLNFVHQGRENAYTQIITKQELLPVYLVVIIYIVLLCFSALFSGLNLGLMSLDLTELNILKKCGSVDKHEKSYATKIYPLRKKGNLLLCTILLGNVLVNSTSTLILGSYVEGLFAALGSTMLIVTFGEIIPQAVCSRHGLAVGAHTRYITYAIMGLTFVVSYPLSKVLDFFLGKEIASVYSRDKVRELMRQAMVSNGDAGGAGTGIEQKQYKLITGALDFKRKTVKEIMVPLKDVFSLDINSVLDFDTFKLILFHGYSRIPVYEHTKYVFFYPDSIIQKKIKVIELCLASALSS